MAMNNLGQLDRRNLEFAGDRGAESVIAQIKLSLKLCTSMASAWPKYKDSNTNALHLKRYIIETNFHVHLIRTI